MTDLLHLRQDLVVQTYGRYQVAQMEFTAALDARNALLRELLLRWIIPVVHRALGDRLQFPDSRTNPDAFVTFRVAGWLYEIRVTRSPEVPVEIRRLENVYIHMPPGAPLFHGPPLPESGLWRCSPEALTPQYIIDIIEGRSEPKKDTHE